MLDKKNEIEIVSEIESNSPKKQLYQTKEYTAFNIMKTIIGAGIFGAPAALSHTGFIFGLVLAIIMGMVFYWSIMTLVYAHIESEKPTIQTLMKHCFGSKGEVVLFLVFFLNTIGCVMSYTIIIGDVMPKALRYVVGEPQTTFMVLALSRRGTVILTSLCIILPVSMARSLAHLGKYSGIALLAILTIIGCVLGVGFGGNLDPTYLGAEPISYFRPSGISGAISVFSFAYVCQHNILLNYTSLKNATPKTFSSVIKFSLTVTVLLTIAIGCAYIPFREKAQSNILNSFPDNNGIINICRLLFGLDMLFTYPLELFIARDTVVQFFFKHQPFSYIRHTIITVAIVGLTILVGCLVCDLGVVLELTGGICASFIGFVMPSSCWLMVNRKKNVPLSTRSKASHYALIVFGFAVMILSVTMEIIHLVGGHNKTSCNWY